MKELSGRDGKRRAVVLTVLAGVLWGTSFPAIKLGLRYVDAYMFVFMRFLVASVIMFFVLLFRGNHGLEFAKKRVIWLMGIANGVAYLFQYVGMNFTSASKSSLLVNLSAIWVAALSWLILKDRLGIKRAFGIFSGLLGVFLIATNLNFQTLGQSTVFGDMTVLLSGAIWAFFTVYNKKLVSNAKDIIQPITWVLFITLLPLTPFLVLSTSSPFQLPIQAWLAIAYTAVFCWVIPYYLWSEGLKSMSPVSSTLILLTEVVVSLAVSSLMLNDTLTLISGVGAIFIMSAIILAS